MIKRQVARRGIAAIVSIFAVVLVLGSCASTPEPVEPAPEPAAEPAPTTQVPAPDAERAQAEQLKKEIETYGLTDLARSDYDAGVSAYNDGVGLIGKDNASAKQKLETAIASFQSVIDSTFPQVLKERRARVDVAKKAADDAKAPVAAAATYQSASKMVADAETAQAAGNYANAYDLLTQAEQQFLAAQRSAEELRAKALAAMQKADAAVKQAEEGAKSLESEIQNESSSQGQGE